MLVAVGHIRAVLMGTPSFSRRERLSIHLCRLLSPQTALVLVTSDATSASCLRYALDCGVTAFLSWPSDPHLIWQALGSGCASRRGRTVAAEEPS